MMSSSAQRMRLRTFLPLRLLLRSKGWRLSSICQYKVIVDWDIRPETQYPMRSTL